MRGRSSRTAPILLNQLLQVSLASEQISAALKFSELSYKLRINISVNLLSNQLDIVHEFITH